MLYLAAPNKILDFILSGARQAHFESLPHCVFVRLYFYFRNIRLANIVPKFSAPKIKTRKGGYEMNLLEKRAKK
jgi:hypothetical protein